MKYRGYGGEQGLHLCTDINIKLHRPWRDYVSGSIVSCGWIASGRGAEVLTHVLRRENKRTRRFPEHRMQ